MANKYEYVKRSIDKRKRFVDGLKENPCERCGKSFHPCAMQWHHKDPSIKKFSIGRGLYRQSMKAIKEEIRKCVLYCANCHAIVEYELRHDVKI